jgi:predicted nucleic acid-binding protein
VARTLVDKSAYEIARRNQQAESVLTRLAVGPSQATSGIVALEMLYSARSLRDYEKLRRELSAMIWLPTTDEIVSRAIDVQHALARRGQHRLPIPDLIIAATAEHHAATLMHHDGDFDLIAKVTGQPAEWIVPPAAGGAPEADQVR